ncbi:ATP-binding protein [Candidatus Omnitrophota bacterium]
MNKRQISFGRFSITTKFILWFLFVALVPLVIATYISYDRSREILEEEVAKSLFAVADNETHQIEVYLRDKERAVTNLSHMSELVEAVERFAAVAELGRESPEYLQVDQELRPFLSYYKDSTGYDDLFLIDAQGLILFSVEEKVNLQSVYEIALYKDSELARALIEVKESLRTEVSDFEYSPEDKESALFIAAPVFRQADLVGVVALQMSNSELSEMLRDYNGLGETGETMIVSRMQDKTVFITPLRFDPEAAFTRELATDSENQIDIEGLVEAKYGTGATNIDYRGEEVVTVIRYLPSFRWGLVVKMDTAEIFASAERLRDTLLTVSFILLGVVVLMAILIARSVSSPIKNLTEVSSVITGGNLKARAQVKSEDEIGELANSFNQMTDSLVKAKANVEQKKEELEEQKGLLEEANRELDSFVYTASHDLRAPLRGISSFASFLVEDYQDKLDDEGKDYVHEIRDGANRMNELIEDLLKLSRISRIKNPYERVNINEIVKSVLKRIEFDIKEKKVDLKVHPGLPTINCDRIKLNEVFLNLINNAIKFSSKNKKENPRVEVGYQDDGEFHKFFVKDNGIGIDPKYHDQIFGIFKRLHTAKEFEGTGAGLSIVKRVIDDHKGEIWIESQAGQGATFYFTIPKELSKQVNLKSD